MPLRVQNICLPGSKAYKWKKDSLDHFRPEKTWAHSVESPSQAGLRLLLQESQKLFWDPTTPLEWLGDSAVGAGWWWTHPAPERTTQKQEAEAAPLWGAFLGSFSAPVAGVKNADEAELKQVASEPLELTVYNVLDFPLLSSLVSRLTRVLCTRIKEKSNKENAGEVKPSQWGLSFLLLSIHLPSH